MGKAALEGQPQRVEYPVVALDRWFEAYLAPAQGRGEGKFVAVFKDITERRRIAEQIRQSQERQAFLLRLSDTLRPLSDSTQIQTAACRLLCEHLDAQRVNYADIDGDEFIIRCSYTRGVAPITGRGLITTYSHGLLEVYRRNGAIAINDVATNPHFDERDRANYAQVNIAATLSVMLVENDRWVASFAAHSSTPRQWTTDEMTLVRETAERIWTSVDRARAEESLRQLEERNRIALEAAELGTWEWRLATDEVRWNEQLFRLLFMDPQREPLTSADFINHVHPDDRERIIAKLTNTIEHRVLYDAELRVVRDDGHTRWMSSYGRVTEEVDGKPTRVNGVMFDITDRKEAQEALRQSEERLQLAINGARIFTWEINGQTGELITSPNFREVLGFDLATNIRESFLTIHPDDYEWVVTATERALAEGIKLEEEHRIINPQTGETIWVQVRGQSIISGSGVSSRFIGTTQNITKHKLAELALQKSQARLQKAIQIDTVGVLFFDNESNFLEANDALLTMTGYTRQQFDQQPLTPEDITLPEWMPRTRQAMDELKANGLATPYEKEFQRPDGSRWWGLTAGTRLSDNENVEYVIDVTGRKQTEQALRNSEGRFRTLTDAVSQVIWTNDAGGTASISINAGLSTAG